MTNYRTVYVVNPSKRHHDGMLDSVVYRVPAKGFLPLVHFVASHLIGKNESLEQFDSILDVMDRIKTLGTYDVYFARRADEVKAEEPVASAEEEGQDPEGESKE